MLRPILFLLVAVSAQAYDYRAVVRSRAGVLPGVAVSLEEEGGVVRSATSDPAGVVLFEGLTQETIRLSFSLDGFFVRKKTVMSFTRRDVDDDVTLVQWIPWKLEGRVLAAGVPLPGAHVELLTGADAPASLTTGADGRFRFEPLHDTEFSLRVKAGEGRGRYLWQANRTQQDVQLVVDMAREAPLTRYPED